MSLFWRKTLLALVLVLNVVLLYSLIWGDMGIRAYREQKKLHNKLERRVESLNTANAALKKEIDLLRNDEKYQEKLIRNRLNFVKRNEILYIFPQVEKESAGVKHDD